MDGRLGATAMAMGWGAWSWHLPPAGLRDKVVKIGAKVVRHGRAIIFQMAEVAVPKSLFREILGLIGGLRPAPASS